MEQKPCPNCGQLTLRLQNAITGQHTLVDIEPNAEGYLVVHAEKGVYEVLSERHRQLYDELVAKRQIHMPHFPMCPASADWRRLGADTAMSRTR